MKKNPMGNIQICKRILEEIQDLTFILEDINKIEFIDNMILQKATVMTLLNIGELCNKFDSTLRDKYSAIPWKAVIGLRNIAAHDYGIIDEDIIWDTVKVDIPTLEKDIFNIMNELQI